LNKNGTGDLIKITTVVLRKTKPVSHEKSVKCKNRVKTETAKPYLGMIKKEKRKL